MDHLNLLTALLAIGGTVGFLVACVISFKKNRVESAVQAVDLWRNLYEGEKATQDKTIADLKAENAEWKRENLRLKRRNLYLWNLLDNEIRNLETTQRDADGGN